MRQTWRAKIIKMLRKKLSGRDKEKYKHAINKAYDNNNEGYSVPLVKTQI
jgi:hypothetical protein